MSLVDAQQNRKGAQVVLSYVIGRNRRPFSTIEDSVQEGFDTVM